MEEAQNKARENKAKDVAAQAQDRLQVRCPLCVKRRSALPVVPNKDLWMPGSDAFHAYKQLLILTCIRKK